MSRFLIEKFSDIKPYTPGEQPVGYEYIKLNTNESPFPPSPLALNAINKDKIEGLRLYSDIEASKTTKAIANYYNVDVDNIIVTNGSDEVLAFIFMAFADEHTYIACPNISYGFYPVFAKIFDKQYLSIPLKSDLSLDIDAFCGLNHTIVIANPNAPTGLMISLEDIKRIATSNANNIVVIDEAYIDFGGESAVQLTKTLGNLIITQTFSKSRSLAGARLGFAIANSDIIADLRKIKFSFNPYNVNSMTDELGGIAMSDTKYFNTTRQMIIDNRQYLTAELRKLNFVVLDSMANFVFAKSNNITAECYCAKLKEKGILIRHFNTPLIYNYVRISIGTIEDMLTLINATKAILKEINI